MANDNIIYAQVLLLDNKIESWKICQDKKYSPYDFKAYWKNDRIEDYTMETYIFNKNKVNIAIGWDFNSYVYNVLAPRWINQWEYTEDYHGSKAKESSLDEHEEFLKEFNRAFGGRFEIVGRLGEN